MAEAPTVAEWTFLVQAYAVCTAVLAVKYIFSCQISGDMSHHPPEDKKFLADLPVPSLRVKRQFQNDLENIPMTLVVLWGAFIMQNLSNASGHGKQGTFLLTICVIAFTVVRLLFTACYLLAIQPVRTISYAISLLVTFVSIYLMVKAALVSDVSGFLAGVCKQ